MFGNGNWQLNLTGTWKFFSHAVMHLGIPFPLCCQYCLPFLDLLSDGTLNSWKFATTKEFYESFIYFPWWVLNTSDCAAWSLGLKRVRSYGLIIFATVSISHSCFAFQCWYNYLDFLFEVCSFYFNISILVLFVLQLCSSLQFQLHIYLMASPKGSVDR